MQKKLFIPVLPHLFNKRAFFPLSLLAASLVSCGGSGDNSESGDRLPAGSKLVFSSNPTYSNRPENDRQLHSFSLHVVGSGTDLCSTWLNNSSNVVGSPSSNPVAVIYRRNGREATLNLTAQYTQSQIVLPGPVTEYTSLTATISARITYPNDHPSSYAPERGTCVYSASFEGSRDSEYPNRFSFENIPEGLVTFHPAAG